MDDTTEIESNAIIDTEDYTEEDDEPEEATARNVYLPAVMKQEK